MLAAASAAAGGPSTSSELTARPIRVSQRSTASSSMRCASPRPCSMLRSEYPATPVRCQAWMMVSSAPWRSASSAAQSNAVAAAFESSIPTAIRRSGCRCCPRSAITGHDLRRNAAPEVEQSNRRVVVPKCDSPTIRRSALPALSTSAFCVSRPMAVSSIDSSGWSRRVAATASVRRSPCRAVQVSAEHDTAEHVTICNSAPRAIASWAAHSTIDTAVDLASSPSTTSGCGDASIGSSSTAVVFTVSNTLMD